MGIVGKMLGSKSNRDIKAIGPVVTQIIDIEPQITALSDDELRGKTQEFRQRIADHIQADKQEVIDQKATIEQEEDIMEREKMWENVDRLEKSIYEKTQNILDDILPEAFAVIKETARRFKEIGQLEVTATEFDKNLAPSRDGMEIIGEKVIFKNEWTAGGSFIKWDMVHYDVQLIGGIVLHQGKIAEMGTGEGKTLVATLPVYLNALPGKGVHIVTVNDYLAKRDSEWMGVLYEFHGLTVDCIDRHEPNSEPRRKAYLADITFGTNNEFGFDYLRDNMTGNPKELVQRKHNYTIVDEVDSVLVDDARTPLIISGPTPQGDKHEYHELKPLVQKLYSAQRNYVTKILAEAKKLLKDGNTDDEHKEGSKLLLRAHRGLPKNTALIKFLSEPGVRAMMQKTENFFLAEQGKKMHIIDDELFFVIEEKSNSIDLREKGMELFTQETGDSNFYLLPDIGGEIAEMEKSNLSETKTLEKKSEMIREYSMKSERVHSVNQLLKAYAMFEKDVEYVIMENKIKIVDEQTGRIMEGRRYSDGLHQALEAKENVKVEAATQTYATITLQNYFRMYEKLAGMTGTAETEAGEFWDIYKLDCVVIPTNRPIVRDDRQDMVFKTKREKYNAVIDECEMLVKEGRPVLVGTTSVETSELLSRMLTRKKIKHNVLNAKLHKREADVVAEAGQAGAVTIATNMAGRGTDIKLQDGVIKAGGLAIIGTERHDSRRVDRQLRGRAGRQGDPGSSQFFVALEDDLMRMFGSARIAKIMDRLGLKEGEVIQHSMITKSIERAQKKVEENNFGIRKRLLEYDDVMNAQREVIYKKRRHALHGERLAVDLMNMMYDVGEKIIIDMQEQGDYDGFKMELITTLGIESPISEKEFSNESSTVIADKIFEVVIQSYKDKSAIIARNALPVIKNVYETQTQYENILVPVTDGIKTMQIIANLKKSYESEGKDVVLSIEKGISLGMIDEEWKEHLRELDDLKQSVQSATYEQKDPLLIYKFESFNLFKTMIEKINNEVVSFLVKGNIPMQDPNSVKEAQAPRGLDNSKLKEERTDLLSQAHSDTQGARSSTPIIRTEKKYGRNDKVKVQYNDGRVAEKKYKMVENDIKRGECRIV
ncbi:MAG: preprotein translocase subunit SecA [Bacteroidetes bacterium]|nr:MAG: preprotein translocase subunit SecA [Bacteroidota bacterium]